MKYRLDEYLVKKKLAENKTKAQALIMSGVVFSKEKKLEKPGIKISEDIHIELRGNKNKWVSRGGNKLEHALDYFLIDPSGLTAIDVGASTGGFSHVLLERGIAKIFCVDVGYGQLDPRVSNDSRVKVLDRTNARYISEKDINVKLDLVVCDVSFISLKTILPSILNLTNDKSYLVSLIKPQFEVGKGLVGKGGIVRDCILHDKVCNDIEDWINNQPSWKSFGVTPSPILGKSGNKEFLIFARKSKLYI